MSMSGWNGQSNNFDIGQTGVGQAQVWKGCQLELGGCVEGQLPLRFKWKHLQAIENAGSHVWISKL